MVKYLNIQTETLKRLGALYTAQEINSQPEMWRQTYRLLLDQKDELLAFFDNVLKYSDLDILLSGAGTSAFIGEVLEGPWQLHSGKSCRAVATTHIVTHPQHYLIKTKPTLLISFARSGNSPESVKAVELANQLCDKVFHLIITCNPEGQLARSADFQSDFVFLLPEETNDKSLAMTSSFTSMLLAGLLLARFSEIDLLSSNVEQAARYAQKVLDSYLSQLKHVSEMLFSRAVFLGSGLFHGIAHEAHLKLQELTDGKVVCSYDTFMGFRHGPKAVIDDNTLLVFSFSNNTYVRSYEMDLVNAVNNGGRGLFRIGIMENDLPLDMDLKLILGNEKKILDEEFLALVSILPAQIIGFFKSIHLGLEPDSPCESGAITRVVQGVELYPFSINNIQSDVS